MSTSPPPTSLWVIRVVILALGAALAIALIARGDVLIGGLIGALVIARTILFVQMRHRRRELRRRWERLRS